jgi:undecaprenyl-diphosphooligosaccharide--protein glycosyltransferase
MTRSPALTVAFVILCGLAVMGALAVHHTDMLVDRGLHSHGVPHVGNNDGYFHLDQARTLASSGKSVSGVFADSRQSMLLPYLLSSVAGDADTLHLVAAYLGPLLGLSMLLAVLPWAMDAGSRFSAWGASLLALLSPYWITRTHVGFLDTDSLVPGVCLFALFCLYRFSVGEKRRLLWGAGYALASAFCWFWWRPGAFLCAGFALCYLIHPARTRADRVLKTALATAFLIGAGLAVAGVRPLAGVLAYISSHLELAFGATEGSLLSSAIMELKGVGVVGLGEKGLGTVWLLPPAVVGTVAYGVRLRWRALFLISGWALGVAGLFSQRFIPLFVPVGAFFAAYGLAACCTWAASFAGRIGKPEMVRAGFLAVCLPLLLWGAASKAVNAEPKSYFTRSDFELAETVRESFPPETVIWTWWDFGYFFRYLTGMETYFDGGSQTERTCFVAAYPLMQGDESVAAAWMRHFAGPGPKHFTVAEQGERWPGYLADFTQKIVNNEGGHGPVALVLPARVYATTTGFLYAFAHVFDETVPAVSNHLDLFPKEGFHYTPGGQSVLVPQAMLDKGYGSFGGVIAATGVNPETVDFSSVPDPYLVFSDTADFLAVTDRPMITSVLFRLLGLFPYDTRHFEPVAFGYRSGGVWRVR